MCKWASQAYLSLHGLLQGPPLKITRCLKTRFQEFLACLHVLNKQTKNISIIVWNQQSKNFCTGSFDKALQKISPFGSSTLSFRDNEEQTFFSLASGPTRTLRRIFWAGLHFPQIHDQLARTVETKKNDTRVLQRLDSSHRKCSYPGPEKCFYRQWCYLSAAMRLFLPTLSVWSNLISEEEEENLGKFLCILKVKIFIFLKEKLTTKLLDASFMVCFWKKKPRAIWIYSQKRVLQIPHMFEWAQKLPKPSILLELPLPGILLPGHPSGVKRYEWHFWPTGGFCDLKQKAYFCTKTILFPRRWCT